MSDPVRAQTIRKQTIGLATLFEQISRSVYDRKGPKEMQPAQWSALRYFLRAGPEASTVTGFAKFMGITKGPASRALASLERRKYLKAEKSPNDARITIYHLTKLGRKIANSDPLLGFAEEIGKMPDKERLALASALTYLANTLILKKNTRT